MMTTFLQHSIAFLALAIKSKKINISFLSLLFTVIMDNYLFYKTHFTQSKDSSLSLNRYNTIFA